MLLSRVIFVGRLLVAAFRVLIATFLFLLVGLGRLLGIPLWELLRQRGFVGLNFANIAGALDGGQQPLCIVAVPCLSVAGAGVSSRNIKRINIAHPNDDCARGLVIKNARDAHVHIHVEAHGRVLHQHSVKREAAAPIEAHN